MALRTRQHFALTFSVLVAAVATMPQTASAKCNAEARPQSPPPRNTSRSSPLIEMITSTVAPDTWDDVGGQASIQVVDAWGVAVVSTTDDVHSQIGTLLSTIRKVRQQQDGQPGVAEDAAKLEVRFVEDAASASARARIEEALNSEAEFAFQQTPLSDVVAHLEQLHGIQIEIDGKALEAIALTVDTPVTKQLSGITLRSGLNLLLRDLGLTYCIQAEVLQITTPDEAEGRLTTRVYPIKDLLVEPLPPEVDRSSGTATAP